MMMMVGSHREDLRVNKDTRAHAVNYIKLQYSINYHYLLLLFIIYHLVCLLVGNHKEDLQVNKDTSAQAVNYVQLQYFIM